MRLLSAFLLAALLAACGGGSPANNATVTPTPAPGATPTATYGQQIIAFGRTVSKDGASFTANSYRRTANENGHAAPQGKEWLIFDLTVSNAGETAFDVAIDLRDDYGQAIERATDLDLADEFAQTVQAGQTVRGQVAFVAPKGVGPTLRFGPNDFLWAIQVSLLP